MRQFATQRIGILLATAVACTACGSITGIVGGETKSLANTDEQSSGPAGAYGDQIAVQSAIGRVKTQGQEGRISSLAIRLPERPLGEIAVFGYRFPEICGSHEFRVYEARDTQILEYRYLGQDGESHSIRDYVRGSSPFVGPGLWTAYDHTAGSISTMTSQIEQSGDRMFKGAYSQGLVTGLPDVDQRTLGDAYQRALIDAYSCGDEQILASASGK